MQVFRKLDEIPADFGPTVVTIGNFDGVHRAHQYVIGEMVRRARQIGRRPSRSPSIRILFASSAHAKRQRSSPPFPAS